MSDTAASIKSSRQLVTARQKSEFRETLFRREDEKAFRENSAT